MKDIVSGFRDLSEHMRKRTDLIEDDIVDAKQLAYLNRETFLSILAVLERIDERLARADEKERSADRGGIFPA